MPPQVGRAGEASAPPIPQAPVQIEETKSKEVEKTPEQDQGAQSKTEAAPHRATAKETAVRKAEVGAGGTATKAVLDKKLAQQDTGKTKTADPLARPTYDQGFYEKVADMPKEDVKKWYNSRPDVHKPLLENYQKLDASKMNAESRTKLEKLGGQLQKLQDEYNASTPLERHRGRSQDEIAKSYLDRIETAAAGRDGARAAQKEVDSMVKDLRLLAQTDKSNGNTYKNAMGAFKQVMNHKTQNVHSTGSRPTVSMADVISSAEKLQGPGSGTVKADLIETMVQQKKEKQVAQLSKEMPGLPKEMLKVIAENTENGADALKKLEKYEKYAGQAKVAWNTMKQISTKISDQPYPGEYVARLINSDPSTMAREFQARAGENPKQKIVMDEALKSVYLAHRKNPDKAADVVGGMLGATARELAEASRERPMDKDKVGDLGARSGFMLRSAQTMVETMASDKKKLIDEGAFIAQIVGKGAAHLSGFPGIKEHVDKVVDSQKDKEYNEVAEWQKGITDGYRDLMDAAFVAGKPKAAPGSEEMDNYKDALDRYHRGMEEGIRLHQSFEARQK